MGDIVSLKTLRFRHSGDIGDLISSLASVKEICEKDRAKAIMVLDASGGWMDEHVKVQAPNGLKFNRKAAEFVEPLLNVQPYIAGVEIDDYGNKPVDFNLNAFRRYFLDRGSAIETNQNLMMLHQKACGLEIGYKGAWLVAPGDSIRHEFILARTPRYQSSHIFCDAIKKAVVEHGEFIGTDFEHQLWKETFGYLPKRLQVKDMLEAANAIKSSDMFFSNGTAFYWVAVGLGHPNIYTEVGVQIPTTIFNTKGKWEAPDNIVYVEGYRQFKTSKSKEKIVGCE